MDLIFDAYLRNDEKTIAMALSTAINKIIRVDGISSIEPIYINSYDANPITNGFVLSDVMDFQSHIFYYGHWTVTQGSTGTQTVPLTYEIGGLTVCNDRQAPSSPNMIRESCFFNDANADFTGVTVPTTVKFMGLKIVLREQTVPVIYSQTVPLPTS